MIERNGYRILVSVVLLVWLLATIISCGPTAVTQGDQDKTKPQVAAQSRGGKTMNESNLAITLDDPMAAVPIPEQVPAKERLAELPGTRLWYWDTGGDGTPVVFLHPATGSTLIWLYQQPVFAMAG